MAVPSAPAVGHEQHDRDAEHEVERALGAAARVSANERSASAAGPSASRHGITR
jgi:hypothetical protein